MPLVLNNPAVAALDLEKSTLKLWEEYLKSFFDGGKHDVGRDAQVQFPLAEIRFQEVPHSQPLDGVGIKVVFVAATKPKRYWERTPVPAGAGGVVGGEGGGIIGDELGGDISGETPATETQERDYSDASFLFFVRAVEQSKVTTGSDRLFGLLENSMATLPLARNGFAGPGPGIQSAADHVPRAVEVGGEKSKPRLKAEG